MNSPKTGVNHSLRHYMKHIDFNNIRHIVGQLQRQKSAFEELDITKVWTEAVLIELIKADLLMKYKGD